MQKPPDLTPFSQLCDDIKESPATSILRELCPRQTDKDITPHGKVSLFPGFNHYGKLSLIPTVHAAKQPEAPKRPPPMKYKDLPLYESPHYEYKDYLADKERCPRAGEKVLQNYLYPSVVNTKKRVKNSVGGMLSELCGMKNEFVGHLRKNKDKFKQYMRADENLAVRKGVVAVGTLTGMYLGSGTRGVIKKLFGGALGALATGSLCFPKETDKIFREASYRFGKIALSVFNSLLGTNYKLRERIPCQRDLPPPPPPRPSDRSNKHCEDKKKKKGK